MRSVLDVGCGTGRAIAYLRAELPECVRFKGIDPSPDLIRLAAVKTGLGPDCFDIGSGESLPYESDSYDVVVATGVLHHVSHPELVVAEMIRVARIAVLISDTNTYGMGRLPYRALKILAGHLGIRRCWCSLTRLRPLDLAGHPCTSLDSLYHEVRRAAGRVQGDAQHDRDQCAGERIMFGEFGCRGGGEGARVLIH